jgi:predicted esterase
MEVKEAKIITSKTARYCTLGSDITAAKRIWFACHGYGMLSRYFIRKFAALDPVANFVIAPEGLQRFYLEGFSGRVGATWMTREQRLDDITDYVHYLNLLHESLGLHTRAENQQLIHFGFSQGVATMARYIAMGKYKPDVAAFWAGTFPPDLPPTEAMQAFHHIPTYTLVGNTDPFVGDDDRSNNNLHFDRLKLKPVHIDFNGGHDIDSYALLQLEILLTC